MTKFSPTHEIHVSPSTTIPVVERDGALYTRQEWEAGDAADWSLVDGELRWQGQSAGVYRIGATVELRRLG